MDMMSYPYSTRHYALEGIISGQTSYTLLLDFLDDEGNALHFQKK
jgi:hypothetical protein